MLVSYLSAYGFIVSFFFSWDLGQYIWEILLHTAQQPLLQTPHWGVFCFLRALLRLLLFADQTEFSLSLSHFFGPERVLVVVAMCGSSCLASFTRSWLRVCTGEFTLGFGRAGRHRLCVSLCARAFHCHGQHFFSVMLQGVKNLVFSHFWLSVIFRFAIFQVLFFSGFRSGCVLLKAW